MVGKLTGSKSDGWSLYSNVLNQRKQNDHIGKRRHRLDKKIKKNTR